SELASCNELARRHGVTKGMYVGQAKQLCPELQVVPYDLEAADRASQELFAIMLLITPRLLPASCDEAYLQLVDAQVDCAKHLARVVEATILHRTNVSVTVGIGDNMFQAKFLRPQPIEAMHGVGASLSQLLREHGVISN
uniref:DNA repair protein rev1-like n=1 Tax=Dermatophagoides pteronyssinus TaxID=6956 RepID=A0A6P6YJ01_DERPT